MGWEVETGRPVRSAEMAATVLTSTNLEAVLSASPNPELRRLAVVESESEVVIEGRVSSYYLKQMAQESIRGALGQRRLCNRVEVRR
jgi:hypothetical protein